MRKKLKKERLVWLDIMITLITLVIMAYFYYGTRTLVMSGICLAAALAAELICLRLMNRKFTADDLSCTSDALIISLMMPAVIDFSIPAMACVFAVVAAKNVFGGRLNMIFSPAAAAYLFVFTSWKNELLSYPKPHTITGIFEEPDSLVSSASYVFNTSGSVSATDFELLLGNVSGPIGTVSVLLLSLSAVILMLRKDISAGAFIGTVLGTGLIAYLCPVTASEFTSVKYALTMNMVLFAAIYIISDLRIAPKRNYYAFFYGFFIAVFAYIVVLTTGKENVIVIVSILFTPVALGFKNLEKKIEKLALADSEKSTLSTKKIAEVNENEASAESVQPEASEKEIVTEVTETSDSEYNSGEISETDFIIPEEGGSSDEQS